MKTSLSKVLRVSAWEFERWLKVFDDIFGRFVPKELPISSHGKRKNTWNYSINSYLFEERPQRARKTLQNFRTITPETQTLYLSFKTTFKPVCFYKRALLAAARSTLQSLGLKVQKILSRKYREFAWHFCKQEWFCWQIFKKSSTIF